jgi:ubiquinone/menaquinone biosynthesis C-methylase UbiE
VLVVYDLPFLDKLYPQMLFIGDFLWYTTLLIAGMVAAFVIVACVNRKYSMYSVWRIMSARVDKGIRRNKDQWLGGGTGTGKLAKAAVVAEIGPGLGSNMRYLSGLKSLQRLYLVEPNNYFFPGLRAAADAAGIPAEKVEIVPNSAADMHAIDSNSVDAVICTLVLCSVDEPNETIREVQRILKPGGIFIFIEHVAADPSQDGKAAQMIQWALTVSGVWPLIGDGCELTRNTGEAIAQTSGWAAVEIEDFKLRGVPFFMKPHIGGIATKRSSVEM